MQSYSNLVFLGSAWTLVLGQIIFEYTCLEVGCVFRVGLELLNSSTLDSFPFTERERDRYLLEMLFAPALNVFF